MFLRGKTTFTRILPKGYQISSVLELPIVENGEMMIQATPGRQRKTYWNHAGASGRRRRKICYTIGFGDLQSGIDLNRAGTPLA